MEWGSNDFLETNFFNFLVPMWLKDFKMNKFRSNELFLFSVELSGWMFRTQKWSKIAQFYRNFQEFFSILLFSDIWKYLKFLLQLMSKIKMPCIKKAPSGRKLTISEIEEWKTSFNRLLKHKGRNKIRIKSFQLQKLFALKNLQFNFFSNFFSF